MDSSICCLCCTPTNNYMDLFDEQGLRLQIASIVAKHFWFEIKMDNAYDKSICMTCWWKVENFHVFYTKVLEYHEQYYHLIDKFDEAEERHDEETDNSQLESEFELEEIAANGTESQDGKGEEYTNVTAPKRRRECHKTMSQVMEEDAKIEEYFKLECNLCATKFLKYTDIRGHYRREHNTYGYLMCCNKKFMHKVRMLEHIDQHLNPDKFKCTICNKTFSTKSGLANHSDTHTPESERKYKCTNCPRTFVRQFQLKQHLIYHTRDEDKHFKCDKCDYLASTNSILQSHRRNVHEGLDSVLCYVCAKPFRSENFFKKHFELVHSESQLQVQCQLCGQWFKHERSLRGHMVRHGDSNKQFRCDVCGKEAPNRHALGRHKQYAHSAKKSSTVTATKESIGREEDGSL